MAKQNKMKFFDKLNNWKIKINGINKISNTIRKSISKLNWKCNGGRLIKKLQFHLSSSQFKFTNLWPQIHFNPYGFGKFPVFSFLTATNPFLELVVKFTGNYNKRLLIGSRKREMVRDWLQRGVKSISLGEIEFKYFLLTGKHFYWSFY